MKWEEEMNVNEKKEINEWEWNEINKLGNLYLNEMKKKQMNVNEKKEINECEWKKWKPVFKWNEKKKWMWMKRRK